MRKIEETKLMKLIKHLPNAVTLCNLLCGCLAIVFAMQGTFHAAFILILFGAFFDFCDGLTARALGAYSAIGKELDSLSDLVTFGVAPAIMGLKFLFYADSQWLCYLPLLIALCAALRLAKFNTDESQKDSFSGLPTPASALLFSGLLLYLQLYTTELLFEGTLIVEKWLVIAFSLILSLLMVSKIPMFSFKFSGASDNIAESSGASSNKNRIKFVFLVVAILELIVILLFSNYFTNGLGFSYYGVCMLISFAIFTIILTYILSNVLTAVFKWGRE